MMPAPIARPVALSASARFLNIHRPKPQNLPLTNSVKVSDK
jgi:hypothetical protein